MIPLDTIGDRIKHARKHVGLTQAEFGEKIKTAPNTVTCYERGARTPSDAVIELICTKFGVNELWLRTGEGEPFVKKTRKQEIAEVLGKASISDDVKSRNIRAFAALPDEAHKVLADWAENYAREQGWIE